VKEDKKSGDVSITAVNRDHDDLVGYRPYKPSGGADGGAASSSGAAGGGGASGGAGGATSNEPLVVEEAWKPVGKEIKALFEAVGQPPDRLYSAPEAADAALRYVAQARLEEGAPDSRSIVLDALLCDALFKGVVNTKKGELYPSTLAKAELRERLLARMAPHSRVSRGPATAVRKGAPVPVTIVSERRQGSKRVTRVAGVEAFLIDPAALATECSKKYAAASALSDLPGKHAGQEILIQGEVATEVAEQLHRDHGVPRKFLSVTKK
jgi:translation initiation factor 2D